VRARDEVLSIVAHDLRNPIGVAMLAAGTLVRSGDEERRSRSRAISETIRRSLHRANRLIDDLLDIGRIESGRVSIDARAVAPEDLVHDAVEMIAPLAASASLEVACSVAPGLPPVHADAKRIQQVLGNLLGNALKFTPSGGRVRISATPFDGKIRFGVADTGIGIPAEQLSHVFDRFWQARGDRRGAGLGLAIAKGFVEAHGGRIWAESAAGEGTSFYFTLPVIEESVREVAAS
jgi:signal transduction histidine kinase